ncbi:MAG: citrate lyase holo-[acyl-carrier protein] synthase, partial [Oscillospiraceae bacterium]
MLTKILDDREERFLQKLQLIDKYNLNILSFTLNIPANLKKDKNFINLHKILYKDFIFFLNENKIKIHYEEYKTTNDGPYFFIMTNFDAVFLKKLSIEFEGKTKINRVLDIDVLDSQKNYIDRKFLNKPNRKCFLCNNTANHCIISKTHSNDEISNYAKNIYQLCIKRKNLIYNICNNALKSILYESFLYPKPGLVTPLNDGSHKDM